MAVSAPGNAHVPFLLCDARLVVCLPPSPLVAERVAMSRDDSRIPDRCEQSGAKHVVLVDAVIDLPFPDPTASQFVAIPAFAKQYVCRAYA